MAMRRWTYAVCFETPETQAPYTVRGELSCGSPRRAAALAYTEAAKDANRPIRWKSLVILLEKGEEEAR